MALINDRVVDAALSRLRAGETMDSVLNDYWPSYVGDTRTAHSSDLAALLQRIVALEAWTTQSRESLRGIASRLEHEYGASVGARECRNDARRPVQLATGVPSIEPDDAP